MPKGRKSIELEDLFDDGVEESKPDRDMVLVNAQAERKEPRSSRHAERLKRLQKAQVIEEGEIFGFDNAADGEEELDLGNMKISGGQIHRQRNEEVLKAREENERDSREIMERLDGYEPHDVVTDIDEEIETLKVEKIERKKRESVHQEIVDEILADLLK